MYAHATPPLPALVRSHLRPLLTGRQRDYSRTLTLLVQVLGQTDTAPSHALVQQCADALLSEGQLSPSDAIALVTTVCVRVAESITTAGMAEMAARHSVNSLRQRAMQVRLAVAQRALSRAA